jgi:serine/threonine-protein kinase
MTTDSGSTIEREERLHGALAACLEAIETGRATDLCRTLARHAEFASELAEFLAAREQVEDVAVVLRSLPSMATGELGHGKAGTVLLDADTVGALPEAESRSFGDYDLKEVLGQGGMGVVYRAWQRSLGRFVALKMIRPAHGVSPADVRRFHAEAETIAHLDHPSIVPLYDCGEHQGQYYTTMKLMEGGSLSRQIEQGPVSSRRAAQWVRGVARAIAAAHQAGIVHRDLKPANVVLDGQGQAHVVDFGLAKWVEREASVTASGAIVGTAGYMAPEQVDGRATFASDIYGLGAILYALLTGRPPFHSESVWATLEQVRHQEPAAPRLLNSKVDRDLELICLTCLEKDPGRRYASAAAVAEDLDSYLTGAPLQHARPAGWLASLFRPIERHAQIEVREQTGRACYHAAGIVLLSHLAVLALIRADQPLVLVWLVLAFSLALRAVNYWNLLTRDARSAHPAERYVAASWFGQMLAYPFLFVGPAMGPGAAALAAYPPLALLTGLVIFVHGSLYWGRLYAVGLAFYALALLMPLHLEWAPLQFGLLHAGYLIVMGRHLRGHQRTAPVAARIGAPAETQEGEIRGGSC